MAQTYEQYQEAQWRAQYEEWKQWRLLDDVNADVSEEAWADELVADEEARAEDAMWKRGCR